MSLEKREKVKVIIMVTFMNILHIAVAMKDTKTAFTFGSYIQLATDMEKVEDSECAISGCD